LPSRNRFYPTPSHEFLRKTTHTTGEPNEQNRSHHCNLIIYKDIGIYIAKIEDCMGLCIEKFTILAEIE